MVGSQMWFSGGFFVTYTGKWNHWPTWGELGVGTHPKVGEHA